MDETGEASLAKINPEYKVFGLGGVIIKDSLLSKVVSELDEVKKTVFGNSDIILHSVELRKRKGDFKILNDPEKMELFYSLFNNFIENADVTFVSVFVDKPAHVSKYNKPYDPYEWSTTLLMERFYHILKSVNGKGKIILEARGKREDKEVKDSFLRAMHGGTRYVSSSMFMDRIDDHIDFEAKHLNGTGLQLADMMLYPVARALLNNDPTNPAYHIVARKMHSSYGCNVFPSPSHPLWLTQSYSNYTKFAALYPSPLFGKKT